MNVKPRKEGQSYVTTVKILPSDRINLFKSGVTLQEFLRSALDGLSKDKSKKK